MNARQATVENECVQKGYPRGSKDFQTCVTLVWNDPSTHGIMSGTTATMLLVPLWAGTMFLSDQRAKRDVVRVGSWKGLGVYRFRYLWSDDVHTGVMGPAHRPCGCLRRP